MRLLSRNTWVLGLVLGWLAHAAQARPQVREEPKSPIWQLLESAADAKGIRADFDAVPAHLAAMVAGSKQALGGHALTRVSRALSQPWTVPAIALELRDGLAAPVTPKGASELVPLIDAATQWLDLELTPTAADAAPMPDYESLWQTIAAPEVVEQALIEGLSEYLAACHGALDTLTPSMSHDELVLLRESFPDWCEAFFRTHDPKPELTPAASALSERYRTLFPKVDRARLLATTRAVVRLAEPAFLATLTRRLARTPRSKQKVEGFSGDVVAVAGDSAERRVVLLGPGKTTITGSAALVIDLGGDDTWQRAAVVDGPEALVQVVIDLDGNDSHVSAGPGPAYAAGGVALLVDVRGKDRYKSQRLGQAASSLGSAVLLDLEGDDTYSAEDFSQAYTFGGIALLLDRAGDDTYDAWAYAQGAGNGPGIAACVDGAGDDRYVANGHWPDVYGDSGPGSYHGASQGYSFGFRDGVVLPGGIGALIDLGGEDRYESGNFSQGGAYFHGFGLMYDGGGNDENHGYRYSQGFGVHQAVGIRWDAAGDDWYSTQCAANCGAAWDEAVGWLIDEAGDDRYDVGSLALGGTANTAVAILFDGAGDDSYGGAGGTESQGGSGDSTYHSKQAIGALLDLGGGKDTYTRASRGDECFLTGDWFGFFLDAKEKDPARLLRSNELKKLLAK